MAQERFTILGVNFSAMDLGRAVDSVEDMVSRRTKGYVCVCPVSTIMAAQEDESFRRIVNSADIVTTDGMPSVWIARARGLRNVGRVYGPDLMLKVCERSQAKGYRHYFYGSTGEVLDKLKGKLLQKFPELQICGMYAPPFRELRKEEGEHVVDLINQTQPDIVWVGLGSPKQDRWIFEHKGRLTASVSLAVGAAFDFVAGTKPQAPSWIQKCGLEWLFRLCCEPKRLWRRYLIGNTRFIYLLLKEKLSRKSLRHA